MLLRLNRRFKALFEKYISSSHTTTTSYSSYPYNTNYRNIYFYEWGNIANTAKRFESVDGFIDFLKECNLTLTNEQREILENNSWCYATCVPRRNILMLSDKYVALKDKYEALDRTPYICTSLSCN